MNELIRQLLQGILEYNLLEATGVIFGLLSVIFAKKENILVFPAGIISVLIYMYLTFQAKLYADMGINGYYFIMSIYGWYYWSGKDKTHEPTPVTSNTKKEWMWTLFILVFSFIILYLILIHLTDSDVPLIDAVTTAIFFVGMQLMAKKKIENWIAWIIGDFISIPLYFYKGLVLTSFQFLIFFLLAIAGYISWKRTLDQRKKY
ncbi:MAG: nicotinamide riboside transporter PnuC [Cyclobacteriaceae bacterium]|nr:nicotinamide riboside transporter PnuC [Cyclobacteriaceae bacterium]